jgi:hypothetical protein
MAAVNISSSASPGFKLSDGNIKILIYFVIGTVLYLVVSGEIRKWRAAKQYALAGNDPNTNQAIGIRQAVNPSGIGIMIDVDFTFVNDLMLIADQIADLPKVATAYNKLYNEIMYERLEKELNATEYQKWIARAQAPPTTVPAAASGTSLNSVYVGKTVKANVLTNVLSDTDSTQVVKSVRANEVVGTYLNSYNYKDKKGVTTKYHLVAWTTYLIINNQGLVKANDVTIVT